MRKFLFTIFLAIVTASTAWAQYIGTNQHTSYRNGHLYTADGVRLNKSTAMAYMPQSDYEKYYLKGRRLFTSGIVLSATGAGIVVGSVLFDVFNSANHTNPYTMYIPVVSWLGSIVGGTLLVASIPLYWVGTVKLKNAATLSFAPPSGGAGLAIRF